MARQQTGIPSRRGHQVYLRIVPTTDLASAHKNTELVFDSLKQLQNRVDLVDEGIARRINEMLLSDLLANIPTPNVQDRLFVATDTGEWFYDIGTAWVRPTVQQLAAGSLPASSPAMNGRVLLDTTNKALVYYVGNQRFRLTGVAF